MKARKSHMIAEDQFHSKDVKSQSSSSTKKSTAPSTAASADSAGTSGDTKTDVTATAGSYTGLRFGRCFSS